MNVKRSLLLIFILASLNATAQKEDYVKFGGALRFNIFDKSWVDDATQPEATLDTWRLNVDARTAGIDLSFEYRFYPTSGNSHFLHHGYLGYGFTDDLYMKLGVSQVPFGITKYASHSWWFQIPYYVGLEDDYDMGIKFDYTGIDKLELNVAYFRQPEFNGGASSDLDANASRYSYDITPSDEAAIRELNQFNLRAAYQLSESVEVGVSGQFGGIYNEVLEESEMSTAFAGHLVANVGNFNFKGEYVYYNYAAKDNSGNTLDKIQMGAYAYNYNVAAEANMVVAGLAYSIPVEWGPISNIQTYVDYSVINKAAAGFEPTQHLVPGMLITAGSIYTYVDYAMGKNNAWLGADTWTNGLAEGSADAEWENRFNINIGYYF
ncbi:hypothetical protein [Geofilum rubicundum]|uniref:Phosphate-selective porin O and P n=1 Tax=Geofilum rubicundum JCM 15548 TaxID=1236989 RepID=A0A0E9M1W2_9BACT|nr:hypothetical protein [Geofilum rubicundum]GAO31361.1 hypothetical protein JCM15548_13714 [Geofilum rubicundum JCM 15548]